MCSPYVIWNGLERERERERERVEMTDITGM
jgi:hypothetical protein